jgi:hypothetical protein
MHKSLFLTGAGLAITWDGKSTNGITNDLICKNKLCCAIYKYLSTKDIKLNFEEIIYSIELLFHHNYSYMYSKDNRLNYIFPKVFNVSLPFNDIIKPLVQKSLKEERVFYHEQFLQAISLISESIKGYSDLVSQKIDLNTKLEVFIKSFSATHPPRCYTTNYDRLFIDAVKSIDFFDGFSLKREDTYHRNYRSLDLNKIIQDRECNCFYNLHGSIYWDVPYGEDKQLAVFDEGFSSIELNYPNRQQLVTANPKEFQLVSPIITGYNKTQRTNLEPFNVFFNSFLQDSFESDIWFIIGYSFSDPHINNTLSTAYNNREGNSPRIIWVSMEKECKTEIDLPFKFAEFRELFSLPPYSEACYKNPDDYFFHSSDRSVYLYFGGFEKFLTDKIWQQII